MMIIFFTFIAVLTVVGAYYCPGGTLTPKQRIDIVKQHNIFRSDLIHGKLKDKDGKHMPHGKNMLKMRWSCRLEASAQSWANRCVVKHSPGEERVGTGENVYAYWSSASVEGARETAGTVAGAHWWSQLSHRYRKNPLNIFTREVYQKRAAHFTQMAWGKTYKIGCGIASHCFLGSALFVVCHYSPGGNIQGKQIYELGWPCQEDDDCKTNEQIYMFGVPFKKDQHRKAKCDVDSGLCKKVYEV